MTTNALFSHPFSRRAPLGALLLLWSALAMAAEPLSLGAVAQAIASSGLSEQGLTDMIEARGVSFVLDDQIAEDLRTAGATEAVLDAIGRSGPPPDASTGARSLGGDGPSNAAGAPVGLSQIEFALESGANQQRLAEMAEQRGIDFAFTPEIGRSLQAAGAGSELLAAIALARSGGVQDAAEETYVEALPEGYVPLPVAQAKDYDPFAMQGRLDLRMHVDGVTEIRIRGDRIIHTNLQARLGRNAGTEMTQPLPSAELASITAVKEDGRGEFVLLQKPSPDNDYQAIVRIYDEKGGEDRYHISIRWQRSE